MSAEIVINYWLNQYQTMGNTLTDIAFDCLPFLIEKEPVYNMKGQKVYKSYYDKTGREAIRISYNQIFEDYSHNGIVYPSVFTGVSKTIHYMDWAGQIGYSKVLQPYYFSLSPVCLGDGTETIIGFSSQKQRKILKEERYAADEWLNSQNPNLYAFLYAKYGIIYQAYLRTGFKEELLNAFESETDSEVLTVLGNEVFGMEPMTIKELIILNLQ